MRRKHFNYNEFDREIKAIELNDGLFRLEYYNIHGNLVKEIVKDKDKRINEIEKERKGFKMLTDEKIVFPIR